VDYKKRAKELVETAEEGLTSSSSDVKKRRAVSSTYYALFHLLIGETAAKINCPNEKLETSLRRSVGHGSVSAACSAFCENATVKKVGKISEVIDPDELINGNYQKILNLAKLLCRLKEQREESDYALSDLKTEFYEIRKWIKQVETAVNNWETIKTSETAQVLLSLVVQKSMGGGRNGTEQ